MVSTTTQKTICQRAEGILNKEFRSWEGAPGWWAMKTLLEVTFLESEGPGVGYFLPLLPGLLLFLSLLSYVLLTNLCMKAKPTICLDIVIFKCQHPQISIGWKTWESQHSREFWLEGWVFSLIESVHLCTGGQVTGDICLWRDLQMIHSYCETLNWTPTKLGDVGRDVAWTIRVYGAC